MGIRMVDFFRIITFGSRNPIVDMFRSESIFALRRMPTLAHGPLDICKFRLFGIILENEWP